MWGETWELREEGEALVVWETSEEVGELAVWGKNEGEEEDEREEGRGDIPAWMTNNSWSM